MNNCGLPGIERAFAFAAATSGLMVLSSSAQPFVYGGKVQRAKSNHESIDWLEVRVNGADDHSLPRYLLMGASVSGGYFAGVASERKGRADVARSAASRCLGDPELLKQLALELDPYRFDVISLKNGLHSWEYTEESYRVAFPKLLVLGKRYAPRAKLIWATSTPLRMGAPDFKQCDPRNERVCAQLHRGGVRRAGRNFLE